MQIYELILIKIYLNVDYIKTQIFLKIKYDLRGNWRSHKVNFLFKSLLFLFKEFDLTGYWRSLLKILFKGFLKIYYYQKLYMNANIMKTQTQIYLKWSMPSEVIEGHIRQTWLMFLWTTFVLFFVLLTLCNR